MAGDPAGASLVQLQRQWELVGAAYALAETAVVKRGSRGVAVHGPHGVESPIRTMAIVDA